MIKYPNHPWSSHSNFDAIKMRNWWSDLDRLKMSSNKQLFVYSLSKCGQITKTMKEEKAAKLTFASSGDRTSPILCITYVKKNTNLLKTNPAQILLFINLPLQDQCWWWTHSLPCRKLEKPPLPVFLLEYLVDVHFFKSISKYSFPIHPQFLSKIRLYLKGISKSFITHYNM